MIYFFLLNTTLIFDPSHGANNDVKRAIDSVGLGDFWKLMMCSWNLPGGPNNDVQRFLGFREAMAHAFSKLTPDSCPLFQSMASDITSAFRAKGHEYPTEVPETDHTWRLLAERGWYVSPGNRTNLNRFQGGVARAIETQGDWAIDLFERTFTALESDFLRGKKLHERLVLKHGSGEAVTEGGNRMSVDVVTIEDRSLKGCLRECCWSFSDASV